MWKEDGVGCEVGAEVVGRAADGELGGASRDLSSASTAPTSTGSMHSSTPKSSSREKENSWRKDRARRGRGSRWKKQINNKMADKQQATTPAKEHVIEEDDEFEEFENEEWKEDQEDADDAKQWEDDWDDEEVDDDFSKQLRAELEKQTTAMQTS